MRKRKGQKQRTHDMRKLLALQSLASMNIETLKCAACKTDFAGLSNTDLSYNIDSITFCLGFLDDMH